MRGSEMSFRAIREQRRLSQERVAEMSGLSLRTVQRVEAGHRVSYASLRALAATFEIDVDRLERELYAARTASEDDFVEVPRWVRVLDAWPFAGPRMSRRDLCVVEAFCIAVAAVVFAGSFLVASESAVRGMRAGAAVAFAAGYLASLFVRMLQSHRLLDVPPGPGVRGG